MLSPLQYLGILSTNATIQYTSGCQLPIRTRLNAADEDLDSCEDDDDSVEETSFP